jgi:tol-pal system protein YbgF
VEIQSLRGKVEETEHSISQQESSSQKTGGEQISRLDRVESVSQKNEDRLYRIEQYLNLESTSKPPPKPAAASKTPQSQTEEALYRSAKQAFDNADYEGAREQFEAFLKKYPKSQIADNAQFWIGETYYREKWYEKAILEYQKVIENYPKGNKVQASLLKQGLAFFNLGDKSNSRLILKELVKKYPNSNEAKIARQKLKDIE